MIIETGYKDVEKRDIAGYQKKKMRILLNPKNNKTNAGYQ